MATFNLATSIVTISVAAISAAAALLGQSLAGAIRRKESEREQYRMLRDERIRAVQEFVDAAQLVENLIDNWRVWPYVDKAMVVPKVEGWEPAPPPTGTEGAARVHKMWAAHRKLQLLCSNNLVQAADAYAARANAFVWSEIPEDQRHEDFLEVCRTKFVDAAKRELAIPLDPASSRPRLGPGE